MTWVLGTASIFGYGGMIADVRVTLSTGETRDCLQKIYHVGPMILAGFAGSVSIGLDLIADLHRFLMVPLEAGTIWYPQPVIWKWRRRGRRIFLAAPPRERHLGSFLMIAAVSPNANGPFNHARCATLDAPEFLPRWHRPGNWFSIGSGQEHQAANYFAEAYAKDYISGIGQADFYGNLGGAVMATASSVVESLRKAPMASVSPVVQFGVARIDRCEIHRLATERYGLGDERTVEAPGALATNWMEFQQMIAGTGGIAAGAVAGVK